MYQGIIFDMDGVIVDTEIIHFQRLLDFLSHEGVFKKKQELFSIVGSSSQSFYKRLANFLGGHTSVKEAREKLESYEKETPLSIDYPQIFRSDVVSVLQYAQKSQLKIGLASSSKLTTIHEVVESCGISQYFEAISSGEMFRESKPNPEIYYHTAKKLKLDPTNCIAIEDSFYGISAAKAAGMTVIAYKEKRFDINQEQADYIGENMLEILDIIRELTT